MVKRALLAALLVASGVSIPYAETVAPAGPVSVPAGTVLHCRTLQTLTTKLNFQGDTFTMNVAEPVTVSGRVAVPAGATLEGRIARMERPGRIKGVGQMRLTVERITLPDGRNLPLSANLMNTYGAEDVRVTGSEGLVKGPSSRVPDFKEIGAGTAGGTLLGLLFAHPFVGATVGLTATTVDRMRRRGKDLTLPVGTQLDYQLTRELVITRSAARARAPQRGHQAGE